tara:strand:- start:41 stop:661 length:621 start_codon:yes stop_codon:yes gene_type:complete
MSINLVIVDYGMGNIWSVRSALSRLGVQPVVSGDPSTVASADALILPGVGSFRKAMLALNANRLTDVITDVVLNKRRKILGICLGMQLLAQTGSEDGRSDGLGFLSASADRFSRDELGSLKVPHIGFNKVVPPSDTQLFKGLSSSYFYFVHSYRLLPTHLQGSSTVCNYGINFLAAYEHENIFATQFHPEKSQTNGLRLLFNFLKA